MTAIRIDDNEWLINNPQKDTPCAEQLIKYTDKTLGAFRELQLCQKASKLALECFSTIGKQLPESLCSFAKRTGTGVEALVIPYFPRAALTAGRSLLNLIVKEDKKDKKNNVSFFTKYGEAIKARSFNISIRSCLDALKDSTEAVSTGCLLYTFVTESARESFKKILPICDFTVDALDLVVSAADAKKAWDLETEASKAIETAAPEAKEAAEARKESINFSKNYYLLRVAKAASAIARTILSIAIPATCLYFGIVPSAGVTALAALGMLVSGIAVVVLAVVRDVYKGMGAFEVREINALA